MQVQNLRYNNYSPNFEAYFHETVVRNGAVSEVVNRNTTYLFRDGYFWKNAVNKISEQFKDAPKINVYFYGCSSGEEPLTFLMSLPTSLTDKIPKIIARDSEDTAIVKALNNSYNLSEQEIINIHKYTGLSRYDYFYEDSERNFYNPSYITYYKARPKLVNKIDYGVANILEDYKNIESTPSVVFARNFWPYLKDEKANLAKNLYEHLEKGSLLFVGGFDNNDGIYKLLQNVGFKEVDLGEIYTRMCWKK